VNFMYISRLIMRLVICVPVVLYELFKFYSYTAILCSKYGYQKVMLLYIVLATVTGAVGAILVPLIVHKIFTRIRRKNVLNVGVITFVILTIMAILCGPYDVIHIFKNRVLNTFFTESNFTNYIFQVALPFSLFAAGLEFIFGKKYAIVVPIKPYSHDEDKMLKIL